MEHFIPNEKKRNYSLDLLKFIASFMIVCIHFKFPGRVGEFMTVMARFAVPVFFMISGYYSNHNDNKKLKHSIWHIAKIYFCAVVIYFCFRILTMVFQGQYQEAVWYVSTYFRIQYTSKVLFFNESITAMHLWFLGALIYVYGMQYLVVRLKIKETTVYAVAILLLLINLALGMGLSVAGVETPEILHKNYILRNFLFMGFPFFVLGRLINKKENAILKSVSTGMLAILVVIGILDAVVMCNIDWAEELYIGSVVLAFAFFVIALKGKEQNYCPKLVALWQTSTNVYLVHVMIGDILAMTVLETMGLYLWLKPVIIFVITVLISLVFNSVISRKRLIKAK